MAEYCLECWNEINGTDDKPNKFIFSKELDLCEGCGKWTHVIVLERKYAYQYRFRYILFRYKILYAILFFLWRILILPYFVYQYVKKSHKRK